MDEKLKPQYINTDFVLESEKNLTPIAESFGDEVLVLYCEKIGEFFRARFEMSGREECPDRVIQHFCALARSLEESERELYDQCFFRYFDIGYEGGLEPGAYMDDIREETIKEMAEIGGSIRITLYRRRDENYDE